MSLKGEFFFGSFRMLHASSTYLMMVLFLLYICQTWQFRFVFVISFLRHSDVWSFSSHIYLKSILARHTLDYNFPKKKTMFQLNRVKYLQKPVRSPNVFLSYKLIRLPVSWMWAEGERLLGQRQKDFVTHSNSCTRFTHHLTPLPEPRLPQDNVRWARVQLHVRWVALRERKLVTLSLGNSSCRYWVARVSPTFCREKMLVFKDLLWGKHVTGKCLVQRQLIFLPTSCAQTQKRPLETWQLSAPSSASCRKWTVTKKSRAWVSWYRQEMPLSCVSWGFLLSKIRMNK